jgi:hypothetical protein
VGSWFMVRVRVMNAVGDRVMNEVRHRVKG